MTAQTATKQSIYLPAETIDILLNSVVPFTDHPKSEAGYILKCVNLQLTPYNQGALSGNWATFSACATDGSRMAVYESPIPVSAEQTNLTFNVCVPLSFFDELSDNWKRKRKTRGVVVLDVTDTEISARAALFTVTAQLYNAEYPRWRQLFPDNHKYEIELLPIADKRPAKKDSPTGYTMGDEAKLISRISPDFPHATMRIKFKEGNANTKIELAGRGMPWRYESICDAVITGGDLEVCFNPDFLAQMFDSLSGVVRIKTAGALKPAVFTCTGIDGLKHLLMPIQAK